MSPKTLVLAAASALAFSSAVGAQTKLVFNAYLPVQNAIMRAAPVPWAEAVAKASASRVRIEFSSAPLAPAPRQLDGVRNGVVDIAMSANSFTRAQAILPMVGEIPLNSKISNARAHSLALWRTYEKFFAKADEFKGVKVLGMFALSPNYFYNGKRAIKTLADARGLKIRTNPDGVAYVDALGAVVVSKPAPDTFEVISSGVADGTIMTTWGMFAFNVVDKQPYAWHLPGGFSRSTFTLIMNAKQWDALSAEDKKAIESVSGEKFADMAGTLMDQFESESIADMKTRNVQITAGTDAMTDELAARMPKRFDEWVADAQKKGIDAKAVLAFYDQQVAAAAKK